MKDFATTYGKTWHTWQVDRGDKVPLGPPQLMMAFTADGQVPNPPPAAAERRKRRAGLKAALSGLELALDLLYGPVYHRLLNGHAPLNEPRPVRMEQTKPSRNLCGRHQPFATCLAKVSRIVPSNSRRSS